MTSRPQAGTQSQPQRSFSGTGFIQRPSPQRRLSQQYSSSAPVRKSENLVDLTLEGSEAGRYGSSRIGGSRLKLELSTDSNTPPIVPESSKAATASPYARNTRGRPNHRFKWVSHELQGSNESSHLSSIQGVENITGQSSMPMPRRPVQSAPPFARTQRVLPAQVPKKDIRPKPYVLGVPAAAPHYLPNAYADFFPWTGDHPEDQFTDHVIRHGFFDKSQATQNETASARLTISPSLKHKSSLQSLSSLYTTILKQRRTHNQITSTSTFKPPPRVTLTDTKRETWLRDLANPSTSLRRLSRTIPHGIRGKALLEQCHSKNIPTARAVWLAKCVGANEIRAFKRKGATGTFAMGGEAKWIRDWTVFVEQFVESIITGCGENDWRGRILYAIGLAAHLYSERLLDQDHYLDWLLGSLESCTLTKVPIWLLITQVYWNDLLEFRKYGSRLVAAICEHLQSAHDDQDRDILLPLIERMTLLLKGLMDTMPESFISPKTWMKYKTTLASYIYSNSQRPSAMYRSINFRNERLTTPDIGTDISPRQLLIGLLDKSLFYPFSASLPKDCREIMSDLSCLTRTILEWCTSLHRPGVAKVYVGVRLLRIWSGSAIDVNDAILGFIGSERCSRGLCKVSLYHLISELTRSGHFSVSRYLQWLIARGGLREPAELAIDGPCSTRLLAEIVTHGMPESTYRLRRVILSRAAFSLEQELEEIRAQTAIAERYLPLPTGSVKLEPEWQELQETKDAISGRASLSRTIKSAIGIWIRSRIALYMADGASASANTWIEDKANVFNSAISLDQFSFVRKALEDIDDISMLADVLKMVMRSGNLQVLTSVADTLNMHVEEFAAIGALNDLFDSLLTWLRSMEEDTNTTNFLAAISEVAAKLPGAEPLAIQLSQDLDRRNRKTAADACSPVSDHVADVLQNPESEFSDEIEKILASGTFMEQSTLDRLFHMIMSRIEASWAKPALQQRHCVLLLSRLRNFDEKHFDCLMTTWLNSCFEQSGRPSLIQVLGPLIAVDCLTFRTVIANSEAVLGSRSALSNPSAGSRIAIETLNLLLGAVEQLDIMTTSDTYHLNIRRLHVERDHAREAICVIRRAVECSIPADLESLRSLCRSEQMLDFLRRTVLSDLDGIIHELILPLPRVSDPESREEVVLLVGRLLDPDTDINRQDRNLASRIEHTLRLADDLTLPFCQLELQSIFGMEGREWSNGDNDNTRCLEAFERAVDFAVERNNRSWTSIVPMLDVQIARHLCHRAETLLLQLIPSNKPEDSNTAPMVEVDHYAQRLLFIAHATLYSMRESRTIQLASQIVDKLNDMWHIASHGNVLSCPSIVDKWLPLLLNFIVLHANMLDTGKVGSELRSRMLLSLSALLVELQAHSNTNTLLLQQIFDVAILLVDDLPEDMRLSCVRSLKDKTSDPRLRYIFGYTASPTDWLQIHQNGKLAPYLLRRWEILSEPTPNIGENDTSLSLALFRARRA